MTLTAPGSPGDKVTFLGADQYNLDAGAVANIASTAAIDTSTKHLDETILWFTGIRGITVPVDPGSTLFVSATAGIIVQISFLIEAAE